MDSTQLNLAAASFQNIDKCSLHTADPGNTGDNDSGITHGTVTWSTTTAGYMYALVTFSSISGDFTHVGLWDGSVFIKGYPYEVSLPTAQDLKVLIEFEAKEAV